MPGAILSFDTVPQYLTSSFRSFIPGESHVTRFCKDSVLLLVYSGTLCFSENKTPIEVAAGQYYIQKADLYQEGLIKSDVPKYYYIHFNGNYTTDSSGLPLSGTFSFTEMKDFLFKLDYAKKSKASTELEKTLLFYRILEKLKCPKSTEAEGPSLAARIERALAEKYNQEISLAALQKEFGYTKDYLIRRFKQAYGATPFQYVAELRMSQARELLLTTNRTVSQIAEECGYHDLSVFYRIFAQAHGCSPKAWKKRMLTDKNRQMQ